MAIWLLALWVPATVHCEVEILPGFEFLQFCCGGDGAQDRDCSQDSCSVVESGLYKIEDHPPLTSGLVGVLAYTASSREVEPAERIVPHVLPAGPAPPELARLWQFSHRAALPPRAPSSISWTGLVG